ncbi:MAG: energy-coupled thiamine transporter ThiT, partial [Clostridia bacterium]
MKKSFSLKLTESAILVAFAIVLSFVKIVDLPYGGSITAFSMLPLVIIAYRNGIGWGVLSAFAFSLIQLFSGMNNLAYATSGMAITAIIFLDYIIAFTVFGFGGIFKKRIKNQGTALAMGVILVGILRYICHIISGCTVWIGLSIPDTQSLIYSTAYNATYMIPEIIISVVGAICISKLLSFKEDTITRTQVVKKEEKSDLAVLFNGIGITSLLFMAVWSIKEIAFNLQNAETGDFDVTGFANVNWMSVIIVAVICIIVFSIFYILSKKASSNNKIS